jgi:transposase
MQIKSLRLPRSRYLERGAAELSREAQKRLAWFDYHASHGRNAALTCRYFGISRQTFYRWKPRFDPQNLRTLEDGSHRPLRRRRPTWTVEQAERVRRLRERYPRWGKDKLAVILRREGWAVSVSRVGRILTSLRQRGALTAPVLFRVKRRRGTADVPGRCANPRIMRWKSRGTWCKSTPWICDLRPG